MVTGEGVAFDAAPASRTVPLNNGFPSGFTAMTPTIEAASVFAASGDGVGSQAKVTRVNPFSPRPVPTQKRAGRPPRGSASVLNARETAGGASGLAGAVARATSSFVSAQ